MQFTSVLAFGLAAFAASATAAANGTVYVTEVVTAYTTVCPAATTLVHDGVTYTATASQTLTVDCASGCTIVKPVTISSVVVCSTCTASVSAGLPQYTNGTGPFATPTSIGTYATLRPTAPPTTAPIIEANSGNKAFAFSGASLAGLLGFAAYFL